MNQNKSFSDFQSKVFRGRNHPDFWRYKAYQLKYVVDIAWPVVMVDQDEHFEALFSDDFEMFNSKPDSHKVCMMLMGYSIENLAKAVIIQRYSSQMPLDKLLKFITNGHDLQFLMCIAQVGTNHQEIILLKELTRAIYTEGRYPVEKTITAMIETIESKSGAGFDCQSPYVKFCILYRKLDDIIKSNWLEME